MRCPNCSSYEWLPSGKCKICGWTLSNKSQAKKETERRNKIYADGLRICPGCQIKTLFYNSRDDQFECLRCKFIITSDAREYRTLAGDWWDKAVLFPKSK